MALIAALSRHATSGKPQRGRRSAKKAARRLPIAAGPWLRQRLDEFAAAAPYAIARGLGLSRDTRWRRGREAEGGGLLNRYRVVKPYRGFESLRLRHSGFPARPCSRVD